MTCILMDTVTYPNRDVREEFDGHWHVAHVDISEDKAVADLFAVAAIPTVIGVTGQGVVLDTVVGFLAPDAFLDALQAMTDARR